MRPRCGESGSRPRLGSRPRPAAAGETLRLRLRPRLPGRLRGGLPPRSLQERDETKYEELSWANRLHCKARGTEQQKLKAVHMPHHMRDHMSSCCNATVCRCARLEANLLSARRAAPLAASSRGRACRSASRSRLRERSSRFAGERASSGL